MRAAENKFSSKKYFANALRLTAISAFVIFLVFPVSALARTAAEYGRDVKAANLLIQNLLYPDTETTDFDNFADLERKNLKEIRTLIPPTEKIEWQGVSVETDNRWLTQKLDEFEQTENEKRWNILTEVGERLKAVEVKLNELDNPATATRSKDEDKQKLSEILRREEYQKPVEQEPSLAEKIQKKITEWIDSIFPRPKVAPSTPTDFQPLASVLQIIVFALILGVIAFVIYRFAPFFVRRFQSRESKKKESRVILGERLAEDETAQNLFAEAENLARSGDLRGAIRKGYIALLCDLSDRQIVRLSQHKTNRDYLRDVRKKAELYQNMNNLTLNYERHWYGFDEAEISDWEHFRDGYQRAVGKA